MTDMTPTAGRLWKRMTFEQRHRAALAFWREDTLARADVSIYLNTLLCHDPGTWPRVPPSAASPPGGRE